MTTAATFRSRWDALTPRVAHGIARLRVDVLVVEAGRARAEAGGLVGRLVGQPDRC